MNQLPRIEAEITFLSESEGGRAIPPSNLSGDGYRPHIVVDDAKQTQAIIAKDMVQETYLGVEFLSGVVRVKPNEPFIAQLGLIYYPQQSYESLIPGTTFTIREGANVVGYGQVKRLLTDNAA